MPINPPEDCTLCPLGLIKGNRVVPGEGSFAENSIFFLGIAPGAVENKLGRPFVGPSGEVLRRNLHILTEAGLDYRIGNAVKHRPPNNRNPKPAERLACLPYLQAELEEWKGRVVVALGESAVRFFAPTARTLTPLIGRPIPIGAGRVVIPSYHPSNVVRGNIGEEIIAEAIRLARDVALGKVDTAHMGTDYRMWNGEQITGECLGLDTESLGWEPFGLSISWADGKGYWVRRDEIRRWWVRGMGETWSDVPVIMHFAPHDLVVLEQMGIPWPDRIEDTQTLARLKGYDIGLKALVLGLFGYVMTSFEELVSAVGGRLDEVTEDAMIGYAVADADWTRRAWFKLKF